jgi:hypothetical protein
MDRITTHHELAVRGSGTRLWRHGTCQTGNPGAPTATDQLRAVLNKILQSLRLSVFRVCWNGATSGVCHCEERSDEAISMSPLMEIASPRSR